MAAVASVTCCSDSASSLPQRWLQEEHRRKGSGRHCSTVCHMPGRLPTCSLHLPHLVYKNIPLSSTEKIIFFFCFFKLVLVVLTVQTLCMNVIVLGYHNKHLWASQWWNKVWVSAIMVLTTGNFTKEKGSLASDRFSYGSLRMNYNLWSVLLGNFACFFICSPAAGMEGAANRNPLDISLL